MFHFSHDLNSDEGVVLNGAWNILNGRVLYVDFFEYAPPGAFYFVWGLWRLFGPHYFIVRLAALLAVFSGAVGVYLIGRKVTGVKGAYAASLLYAAAVSFWPIINHNALSTVWAVWAVYFYFNTLKGSRRYNAVFAGLFTGLTVITLHHKGLALAGAIAVFGLVRFFYRKDRVVWWYLPAILPLPAAVFLSWEPAVLYRNLVLYPMENYLSVQSVMYAFPAFFFLLYAFTAAYWRRRADSGVMFLLWVQPFLFLAALNNPDAVHLTMAFFPVFVLIPAATRWDRPRQWDLPDWIYASLAAAALFLIVVLSALRLVCFPPFYSAENSETIRHIKADCRSRYLYAGPFMPGYYYETRKLNPTPYHILLSGFQTPEQFERAARDLAAKRPDCAVLNYSLMQKWNHDPANPVDRFLRENYELAFASPNKVTAVLKIK